MTGPYVYQTVHTLAGRIWRLAEHIAVMNAASQALFGRSFRPDPATLAGRISHLLATENAPADRSVFVRLLLSPEGKLEETYAGPSLYRGYDLRSLAPEAVCLIYDLPLGEHPTSAREAATALARAHAQALGYRCAVRCDGDGIVHTADDAPLFAVKGQRVVTTPAPASVEALLAAEAVREAGLPLDIRPLQRNELPCFDELFYFDHRGVTALSYCDGEPYMDIVAGRVARAAARLAPHTPGTAPPR